MAEVGFKAKLEKPMGLNKNCLREYVSLETLSGVPGLSFKQNPGIWGSFWLCNTCGREFTSLPDAEVIKHSQGQCGGQAINLKEIA